jgi:light-regulated signal transduction histidine kinase (bacteriophytochrome)
MSNAPVDLTTCDREPIHIPGSIQPHGVLLVLRPDDLSVTQASANASRLWPDGVTGRPVEDLLEAQTAECVRQHGESAQPVLVQTVTVNGETFRAIAHRSGPNLILELERTETTAEVTFPNLYGLVWEFITEIQQLGSVDELARFAASEVRRLTGFDRVMIYRFDEDWNGTVIAEDRNERLPSYRDLRFPASDIPAQARELYRMNRLRLIADANYVPVPIGPAGPAPLDLSYSVLRSVSPIHIEYMKNMGTLSSMSISIVREGRLWGLISCHHPEPRHVEFELRTACDLIGQFFSVQMSARERSAEYERRLQLRSLNARLLASMAREESFIEGLLSDPAETLRLADASGAAVVVEGNIQAIGETPAVEEIRALAEWIGENSNAEVWWHESVAQVFRAAAGFERIACGVLAISISKLHHSYLIWFRPEVIQTVKWGGDPRKAAEPVAGRLHPRKSFEMWAETVRGRSLPWTAAEIEAVTELRNSIVGIVLRTAEELADLSQELQRSNKELEAFSYSVSHDLRAPFRHIVGYAELLSDLESNTLSDTGKRYIATIIDSARFAGTLVDNLLMFSQIGRSALNRVPVDMVSVVRDVIRGLQTELDGRKVKWQVSPLPAAWGDPVLLRLAAQNLIGNALKYTRPRDEAEIEIGCQETAKEVVYFVRDNGVGFDMAYSSKLFGVFQRLHRMEEFEGTGIGLANVRRIVARHGGRTWAEGAVDRGATFYFTLPKRMEDESV